MSSTLTITSKTKISVKNTMLSIEKEEEIIVINLKDVEVIVIESLHTSITSSAMLFIADANVPLIVCNKKHHPQVISLDLYKHYEVSKRIHEQIKWTDNYKINAWKKIIKTKITHQRDNIQKSEINHKFNSYLMEVDDYNSLEKINAIEAISARIYFKEMFGEDFTRKSDDIINEYLNYGYSLIRAMISVMIVSKGLHPSLGICHKSSLNSFNLSDDIIEIYRPMVDYAVKQYNEFNLLSQNQNGFDYR